MVKNKWKDVPRRPDGSYVQSTSYGDVPNSQAEVLQDISKAHVDSFNFVLRQGLSKAVQNIWPMEMELPNKDRLKFQLKDATVGFPVIHRSTVSASTIKVFPKECRLRGVTYRSKLEVQIGWSWNERVQEDLNKVVGEIPIMVKSDACNLKPMSPAELIRHGEEGEEFGGYFIVDGKERIIRFLIHQRRNYPIALTRSNWKTNDPLFTEYGVSIRCCRSDQTSVTNILHYLSDGTAKFMFLYGRERFFIPVMMMLKALCYVGDHEIYQEMTKGKDDGFYKGCIVNMLRALQNEGLFSQAQIRKHIADIFRVKLGLPDWHTSKQVIHYLFKHCVLVHLDSDFDKFELIVFMTRKLFAAAKGECAIENADSTMNHEIVTSGQIYLEVLKEHLEYWLVQLKYQIAAKTKKMTKASQLTKSALTDCIHRLNEVTPKMEYFLKTGNFISRHGSLPQKNGFCIVAEKLNFWRYLSHFRSVHRGQYFAEMRTTTVRKLLPESWGFLCPVHTPDGAPCGLLLHLTAMCEVANVQPPITPLRTLVRSIGVIPNSGIVACYKDSYPVLLDGKVVGWIEKNQAAHIVKQLRYLKSQEKVPPTLEIAFVPSTTHASQYPGIFLFTTPGRMLRPVKSAIGGGIEMIGTMEQVYLHVCLSAKEAYYEDPSNTNHHGNVTEYKRFTYHKELSATSMLSILANMIPFSNYNQSPRNMYECQMGKQTMGTPCHAIKGRADNKLYRLQYPQTPLVRPALYDHYKMDDYPMGTNAIVAVMSYTGYDMEDAIVLNKASVERGFKHGGVYKSEVINLRELGDNFGTQISYIFQRKAGDKSLEKFIDIDGLPYIGTRLTYGDPVCCYIDPATSEAKTHSYKSTDTAYVDDVKLLGNDTGTDVLQKILVTYWVPRNPTIGDKFASRHGQKGICSMLYPQEDLPFTEAGMVPDIIFNPHGFPSRMTIGMLIESMAGKSSSLHGLFHDATPFRFSEDKPINEFFSDHLEAAGYNYQGTERMFSGVSGEELVADIFIGVVYYQRLRHMIADKFQVRTTGPVDSITQQPVKGRKNDGGIRFGEMERDALIAHGASFLLHDRLFNCSDKSRAYVCTKCQNIVSPVLEKPDVPAMLLEEFHREWVCRLCKSQTEVEPVDVPYVFRAFVTELASINVNVKIKLEDKPTYD